MNSKQIIKPKTWNPRDIYKEYAESLLKANPDYWGKYSKQRKLRNFWIYTTVNNKLVEVINFDRWRNIISTYFQKARLRIIEGETLIMGNWLGKIEPRRVERNHANKKINFLATHKRPKIADENGKLRPDVIVYHTDNDWIRISWVKTKQIENETAYKFTPCQGDDSTDGFKEQFSKRNLQNPTLKFNYKFFPYTRQYSLKPGT